MIYTKLCGHGASFKDNKMSSVNIRSRSFTPTGMAREYEVEITCNYGRKDIEDIIKDLNCLLKGG